MTGVKCANSGDGENGQGSAMLPCDGAQLSSRGGVSSRAGQPSVRCSDLSWDVDESLSCLRVLSLGVGRPVLFFLARDSTSRSMFGSVGSFRKISFENRCSRSQSYVAFATLDVSRRCERCPERRVRQPVLRRCTIVVVMMMRWG